MPRSKQRTQQPQRHELPLSQQGIVVTPPASVGAPGASAASTPGTIQFTIVPLSAVPQHRPGLNNGVSKYKPIIDALGKLPKGQSISIPVPAGRDHTKMASGMLSSIRQHLPATRSRATHEAIYLWVDKEAADALRAKKAASHTQGVA